MSSPFVYINGYPGVGKLTVAKELCKLLAESKILDNHHLIDPVAAVFDRSMPEYQPLRRLVRTGILEAIANSPSTKDVTWVFTDQQSSSPCGSAAARDYYDAAQKRGSQFFSIVLECGHDENLKRVQAVGRGGDNNTKLTDSGVLQLIRANEDVYHFGGENELVVDVTYRAPVEVAEVISEFISGRN